MERNSKIRILLAKPGLDGHDVGAKVVLQALLEAGFDVTYTGLRKSPEEIAQCLCEEHIDVLGLSILSGSHIPICQRIKQLLDESGLQRNFLWIVGGNIPKKDHQALADIGVDGVFPVGTPLESIVDFIRENAL